MGALLDELAPHVPADRLVVSVAAGITTAFIERRLRRGHPGRARDVQHAGAGRRGDVRDLRAGRTPPRSTWRAPRRSSPRWAARSACPSRSRTRSPRCPAAGPAYFFYLVEAMIDAGILLGLPRHVAHDLIVQTAIGSA